MEENWRRGSSSAGGLAPQWVPASEWAMAVGPGFWHPGQGIWVARQGPPTSSKAWGKAPAMVSLPLEMEEELAQWIQQ